MKFERYAIYTSPEPGTPLAAFGEAWLGRDAQGNAVTKLPETRGFTGHNELVASPARYGFHGTLKAPFRLNDETRPEALIEALQAFSGETRRATANALELTRLGRFLALCPAGSVEGSEEINALAGEVVRHFDRFRAPLSEQESRRRDPATLSRSRYMNLMDWGYPFVFDEFRFHLTLTGPLDRETRARSQERLAPLVNALPPEPFTIESLCLFGDPGNNKPFRLIERYPLKG